ARAEGSAPAAVALLAPLDAPTAPLAAELALERAEAAQAAGDPQAARALLAVPVQRFPRRPPLWLALSRAAFQQGDFAAAARAQRRLRALKSSQTGAPPPPDLRDMLTDDALRAAPSLPEGPLPGPPGAPKGRGRSPHMGGPLGAGGRRGASARSRVRALTARRLPRFRACRP
ncbi:MAG: hypothetical protein JJU42_04285, partial [Rhodobacteraceae bacterium]|nr:hypothetical protein [Paracoccaceae bacterium]